MLYADCKGVSNYELTSSRQVVSTPRFARRAVGSDPARISAVRTDPTPHRTDAHIGLVRTPLESVRSEPILRRIALMRLSDWFGPARIGADRTNPTRRRTDASVESLRAPPESVRTGPIRHGSDRFDAPD